MARNIKFQFSSNHLKLEFVEEYHQRCLSSIECKYSKDRNINYDTDFPNMTPAEVLGEANKLKAELEKETIFNCLACIEALLRIDYIVRIDKKDKEPLSCYFRSNLKLLKLQKKKTFKTLEIKKKSSRNAIAPNEKYRVDLCDVIIKGWRDYHPEEKVCFDILRDSYKYRNWLAHGRFRQFENENKYNFMTFLNLVAVFKESILPKLKHF